MSGPVGKIKTAIRESQSSANARGVSSTGGQRSPNPDMDMGQGRETTGRNDTSTSRRRRLGEGARRLSSDQVQGMRGGSRTLLG